MRFVVEVADLFAVGLDDAVTAPDRAVATAGAAARLQDGARVAGLAQFVGGGQTADARPDDHHRLPAAAARRQLQRAPAHAPGMASRPIPVMVR